MILTTMPFCATCFDARWFNLERMSTTFSGGLTAASESFPEASCVFWSCSIDEGVLVISAVNFVSPVILGRHQSSRLDVSF